MKWFLEEKYPKADKEIHFGDGVVFLGSCFSQHICEKGKRLGFHFESTNFGTIFHPIPMTRILLDAIHENPAHRIFKSNFNYFSWDASSKMRATSESDLSHQLNFEKMKLHNQLKQAKFLFLTFGTTKAYKNKDGIVVANCHKLPATNFFDEITELSELVKTYRELLVALRDFNPDLEVVLTVSPVRHAKDGLIENNRSKARLLMLCEELEREVSANYFPAYELVIDQLRDYRFYNSDLIHPSAEAIDFVWEAFCATYFSEETMKIAKHVGKFRSYFEHIPLHKEQENDLLLRNQKETELATFLVEHPKVLWQ